MVRGSARNSVVGRAESLQKAWVGLGMQAKEASNVEPSALGQSVMGWMGGPERTASSRGPGRAG